MTSTHVYNSEKFAQFQEQQKLLVQTGQITQEQAVINILNMTVEILNGLKEKDLEQENMYQGVNYN